MIKERRGEWMEGPMIGSGDVSLRSRYVYDTILE